MNRLLVERARTRRGNVVLATRPHGRPLANPQVRPRVDWLHQLGFADDGYLLPWQIGMITQHIASRTPGRPAGIYR